jgi:hypothetical protein
MLIGDGGYIWQTIPVTDQTLSPARRTAKLTLSADGSLDGELKLEFDGHQAIARRRDQFRDSPGKREENIKDEITKKISTAVISALSIENFDDSSKPLTYKMKVHVPNYAQKAGKRLILQPGVFEFGSSPLFSSATRTYDVYFPYPWSESDNIEIRLPEGFELDSADSPPEVADTSNIGRNKVTMTIEKETNTLRYNRYFHFGGGGKILFPVKAYQPIKSLFDTFHKADTHAISIKQKSIPATAGQ